MRTRRPARVLVAAFMAAVAFTGTQITAGSPATVLGLASGSIQGALTARDGAVATLRTDLDNLAHQMVASVNAVYNPTGLTGDFFDAAGIDGGEEGVYFALVQNIGHARSVNS